MKKTLFTLAIVLLALAAQAQIKVHDNGHVSVGSLTQAYGVQVQPSGYTYFHTQDSTSWGWATLSYANDSVQKHWIVSFPKREPNHTFFVTGEGNVYKNRALTLADPRVFSSEERINNAGLMLDNITGFYYTRNDEGSKAKREEGKKRIGVSAEEVREVLPEAVETDENGFQYVNYEALTVVLLEAVKEQRQEIELLRKTLQENGLMRK